MPRDDYDDRPRRRYRDDDDHDRPRRRFDDEDDYDDRPRRRRPVRSAGGSGGLVVGLVIGGVMLLGCGGLAVGYFFFAREMSRPKPPPPVVVAPPVQPAAPARDTTKVLIRLSNLQKGFKVGGANALQVDYVVEEQDEVAGATLYLVAKFKNGNAEMRFTPNHKGSDTIRFDRIGAFGGFAGETQVWLEKDTGGARQRVSNIVSAY
jgi:hypothetical protein